MKVLMSYVGGDWFLFMDLYVYDDSKQMLIAKSEMLRENVRWKYIDKF